MKKKGERPPTVDEIKARHREALLANPPRQRKGESIKEFDARFIRWMEVVRKPKRRP